MDGATAVLRAVLEADHGPSEATVSEGHVRSWADVGLQVRRLATALRHGGLSAGGTVAVAAVNSPALLDLLFAVPHAGGKIALVNYVAVRVVALSPLFLRHLHLL